MIFSRARVQISRNIRSYATPAQNPSPKPSPSSQLSTHSAKQRRTNTNDIITMETAKKWKDMSSGERVVYATKQSSYAGVAIAGLGLSATLLYLVFGELFGTDQATAVYKRALDRVREHEQVLDVLGSPVSGYREHERFSKKRLDVFENPSTGEKTGFMKFAISGPLNDGVVSVWLKESGQGHWEYQHLNVEVGGLGRRGKRIVVEDNR